MCLEFNGKAGIYHREEHLTYHVDRHGLPNSLISHDSVRPVSMFSSQALGPLRSAPPNHTPMHPTWEQVK